jgi:subfamily B ATP-binding cassette protein MsbA
VTEPTRHTTGWQLYRQLLGYSNNYKLALFFSIIGMILAAASDTAFVALMKPLMDEGFVAKDQESIRLIPLAMVGLVFFRGIATFIAEYCIKWVGRRITFDIRNELFERVVNLPSTYYDTHSSSHLISKLIYDVEQLANAATGALFILIRNGLTVIAVFAWMSYLNWKLTLFFLVLAPMIVWLVRVMTHRLRKASERIQHSMGDITKVTQEAADGQRVVKAFNAQDQERETFRQVNNANRQQAMKLTTVSAAGTPILEFLSAIVIGLVIFFALNQAALGEFSAGGFISYLTALMLLMPSAKRLSSVNQTLQMGIAASHSAFGLLQQPIEKDEGTVEKEQVDGAIEYRQVSFEYPGADSVALEDVSFTVAAGNMVALVGASGSGKTTTASLLARFYLPSQGEILVDGANINDYRLENLRKHLSYVSQETILFDDTIRNNIAYGRGGDVDEGRLVEAARAAHVLEFAERLPDGLQTEVGEKGLRLSGGQRQRIAIARAIYKNAPILIMDEATSALDSESERHVQSAMEALTEHRTTLVIAHRLSTIERADMIVVMDQGRVVETGTHKELLAKGGAYAGLYNLQFQTSA